MKRQHVVLVDCMDLDCKGTIWECVESHHIKMYTKSI